MQQLYPDYYHSFSCTADRCPITCCQEWKIGVDAATYQKWEHLTPPPGVAVRRKNLCAYTKKADGQSVIKLDSRHLCPFLDDSSLCRLVLTYGDSALSGTCAAFPRETHIFTHHEEKTLMPCCPAVIDLWYAQSAIRFPQPECDVAGAGDFGSAALASGSQALVSGSGTPAPGSETPIPDAGAQFSGSGTPAPGSPDSALFSLRSHIVNLLQDTTLSPEMALQEIFFILCECNRTQELSAELIKEYFSSESLKQLSNAIYDIAPSLSDTLSECNELLQDLAVNYQREGLYYEYLSTIGTLAEAFSAEDFPALSLGQHAFRNALLPYLPLMRCFLANEAFSDLLMQEDMSLSHMLIRMQWIALQYVAIRQCLFLLWDRDCQNGGTQELSYATVRETMVILTRMTGYEESDIYEYLEECFASPIWEWGYFSLICGDPR